MNKTLKRLILCIVAIGLSTPIAGRAGVIFTNIFSFDGTNGIYPGFLVQAGNNKFYGITQQGGPNFAPPYNEDVGGVFSITSDGVFSNLFFFEVTNGDSGAYLTHGLDGNFYGTTIDTVFKLDPDGTMANPHLATLPSSDVLSFGLVQDHDGSLYGILGNTVPSAYGLIYKIDTNGVLSTLVSFNGTNGVGPVSLLLGLDDNFYGLSDQSGDDVQLGYPLGSIFRTDRNGNLTNIFFLDSSPTCMLQGSDGDLYGLTFDGGTNNDGSIFRVTTNGVLVWSFSFNGTNGYLPDWLTAANDGNFYGVTIRGGSIYNPGVTTGFGTIFRITPSGSFTSLVQFDGTNEAVPVSILQGTDGNLYGAAQGEGTLSPSTIFKVILPSCPCTNRFMLTTVANFYDTNLYGDSDLPEDGLIQASDGMLYGITQDGGPLSLGTVFRTTLSGSLTTLVTFNGTNGANPIAPPLQAADGYFYGATSQGGPDWDTTNGSIYGTIYRMDSNGVVTTIFSFNQTNGAGPGGAGGLIVGNDGALYGVTIAGGANFTNANGGDGTIFRITTNGVFTLLASFNGTNGYEPVDIIQASDGNFYGATHEGGIDDSNGVGTVFQMTPEGQINTLVRFNGTNGAFPAEIMQASDGCLYGTTALGGANYTGASPNYGYGTVYKVTTNGDFSLLASFDGTDGDSPRGGLTEVCNGLFYGTTYVGGLYPNGSTYEASDGTFFQVTSIGDLTALISFGANSLLPAIPLGRLLKASDGNYYGEAQRGGTTNYNYYGDPIYSSGSIFSIRPVQAPVLQPVMQSGQLNLSWNAWAGYSYAVMYETNLTGSNWNLLSTVSPQTNGPASFSDSIGPDTQRFYSVILQLP